MYILYLRQEEVHENISRCEYLSAIFHFHPSDEIKNKKINVYVFLGFLLFNVNGNVSCHLHVKTENYLSTCQIWELFNL